MTQVVLPESLADWLAWLERRNRKPIQLGLERVREVFARLDQPAIMPLVITVGGTNGKGSTCAMLEAILHAAGYRVGCYTSPHLLRYNERVRICGREVSDERLVAALSAVEAVRGEVVLTYFEHGTLAAWQLFASAELDVVVLEVGLGGRLDAVNVIEPDCAIVTSVAMDHMDYLGDTREQIGFEKAGIFRANRPGVCGDPQPPASLIDHARAIGTQLWVSGRDFGFGGDRQQWGYWRYDAPQATGQLHRRGGLAYPALRGANQLLNASAAMTALELVRARLPVSMQAIRQGLMLVEVPGRFQILPGQPTLVLDVAHNPQAAGVLSENLSSMGFYPETWAVLGMLGDKEVEAVVARLSGRVDHWLLADLPGPRGLSADALAARVATAGVSGDVQRFRSPAAAYRAARAKAQDSDRIVVFGSFLSVSDVLAAIEADRR